MAEEETDDLVKKYRDRVERELGGGGVKRVDTKEKKIYSKEYRQFRKEYIPKHMSRYEKFCSISEKTLKLKPDPKKAAEIQEAIDTCHLNVTPSGVVSFSILGPLVFALVTSMFFFMLLKSTFFVIFFIFAGIIMINPLGTLPMFMASAWRIKSGSQMVLCVFYIVTFMRHTSNLELGIEFASDHLGPPLSLDLRKVLWDVETQKFESIQESIESYLKTWKKWNLEFIETFHLIEGSLYESDEKRRLSLLDKSLDIILQETYEKMLHYAQGLKSPLTMLNMLGVVLPILGLVILPLVVSFSENAKWYNISLLYNVALPAGVFYLGKKILSTRPTGYGDTDITELNPELKKYKNVLMKFGGKEVAVNPLYLCLGLGAVLFLIGMSPVLLHAVGFPDVGWGYEDEYSECGKQFCLLDYKEIEIKTTGEKIIMGPFGLGASLLSISITLAFGISAGLYFKLKSQNVIKIREKSKELENEFASALFQLGNRLGDGLPAEMAFGNVADAMEGTVSGKFMEVVSTNIKNLGMGVEQAIFDRQRGALIYYPSSIIESSMKVLTQSVKKGPKVAAQALLNVSRYIKEIHKVDERLKDLMADVVSSMNSQVKFLTPAISGIVIGITSMITTILGKLGPQLKAASEGTEGTGGMLEMFGAGIPTFYFQIVVGLYVVQLVYILTMIANGIENGSDKLYESYALGANLTKSTIVFCLLSATVMFMFNMIAASILEAT
ncbi:hypothetical protein KY360_06785 [Candidatus Woesearchaeota archaeon]|nr:hypothetical protein [Candidatus Woesearchaeota archaeon]